MSDLFLCQTKTTHYPVFERLKPYWLMKSSRLSGPRDPYGYGSGLGASPFFPSIQWRIGVKI